MSQAIDTTSPNSITVQQARRILGRKAENLTDKQVAIIVRSLYALCEKVISEVVKT